MRIFHDIEGRDWRITLDAATIVRVREQTGVDLLAGRRGEPQWTAAAYTPELVAEIILTIYWAVEPQATARGVDFDAFLQGFISAGDQAGRDRTARCFERALCALFRETARITPPERVADVIDACRKLSADTAVG